jgi:transposase
MNQELANEIVHRREGGQSIRGIAADLGIGRKRVARVLRLQRAARDVESLTPELPRPTKERSGKLTEFDETIQRLLNRYSKITVTRVLEELRRQGYCGGYTILRERVKQLRATPTKPLVTRFETSPGLQAQMDWSVYDLNFTQEGRRRVNLFSYLLSYSRRQYLCFTEHQDFDTTIREHIRAFEYLQGVAATSLYDSMKVVVTRWEDDEPVYNTRFLAFATHYGFRPWACRPRRPQTKGKVEKGFLYVETSLLNGRTFRSLEHLNEVTRWWLANVADVRVHRTTKKRPLDAHAEEQPHLLPLPAHHYDTAKVVYRVVDPEGFIGHGNNQYSAPWRMVGHLVPVRVTEDSLFIYDRHIREVARHALLLGQTGQKRQDPAHRPPKNRDKQIAELRTQFAELGQVAGTFLDGLLKRQRYGLKQAQRVLALLRAYHRQDVLKAIERAVRYHAYSCSSLERILNLQAQPKPLWMSESHEELLRKLADENPIEPRRSEEYQHLLFPETESDESTTEQRPDTAGTDHALPGDPEDPPDQPTVG